MHLHLLLLLACGPTPTPPPDQVRDVTQLVRVDVERVAQPHDAQEVQALVRAHEGPISIGGGRFSMGGQVASERTLHLDLRGMDDVVDLDVQSRQITVEAGATWRTIQEAIDPHDLSLQIMQSYANFTVGGSLSVNAHGRYVDRGPVVHSVEAIDLVLADGTLVHATRDHRPDLFFGAIGGYGALGVITQATLRLDDNAAVRRVHTLLPAVDVDTWFTDVLTNHPDAVFANADLYPPAYDRAVAIQFEQTDDPVTVDARLQPEGTSTFWDRTLYWAVMDLPGGAAFRSDAVDPWRLDAEHVVWRNFEASYDARKLEPRSRQDRTYVLQEYFVPIDAYGTFLAQMTEIFQRYQVEVANVSVRHARADPDTLLTWAPEDRYAFVIYYRQQTARYAQTEVGVWTRELIEAALAVDGTYYLPYQLHAHQSQFHRAYPGANALFRLKFQVDPDYRFRNKLWDRYLPPPTSARAASDAAIADALAARDDWLRPEDQTFLTLPEWSIVYSADELGAHLQTGHPSNFPFFAAIGQYWAIRGAVNASVAERYPPNADYQTMLWVIGLSYTIEYGVKGLWEHTVGAMTAWWDGTAPGGTPEDAFVAQLAVDYGAFIHHTPFYSFPWAQKRADLAQVPSAWTVRRQERRFATWAELWLKGLWSDAIRQGTASAYAPEATEILAWVRPSGADPEAVAGVTIKERLGPDDLLIAIPRYEPFTAAVPALTAAGVEFVQIAGNQRLLVQVLADATWDEARLYGATLYSWPVLTQPGKKRVAMEVPVGDLHEVLPHLDGHGLILEHLYDY